MPSPELRVNDKIEVKVFQEEDLTQQVAVAVDGRVRLPLVGSIRVGGLTTDQAAQRIRAAYADGFLVNPQVTVTLVTAARRKLVVGGQVNRPGSVDLRAGERMTILQAIAEVGGATRLANLRGVLVKRMAGGHERLFKIDCKAMATNPKIPPFYVEEGDVITVKESIF
ncbi:MAG: polysaccharide biosynthesis/export family protein [Verrucomicrobiales bacterium]